MSVLVVRPFDYLGRAVTAGEWIDLEPLDAAVKAQAGLVSLSHGNTYQTRDMVAATPLQGTPVQGMTTSSFVTPPPDLVPQTPPKRRRGRPRKAQ